MTAKTFSVAGVSTFKGVTKVRFANDFVSRIKILAKNEHTDVELIELGTELTKEEVCKVLVAHPKFQSETAQAAIAEYLTRNVKQPKEAKAKTTKLEQDIKAALEASKDKINLDEIEEAPF
tara:strand:+ start:522 stop:884 length:363 start_codon:yes stop_codon:yes gene_type:complete